MFFSILFNLLESTNKRAYVFADSFLNFYIEATFRRNVKVLTGDVVNYTGVTFGGTPATHISQHDESLKVTVPEGKAGSVEVVVTTPYGEGSSSTKYTYN